VDNDIKSRMSTIVTSVSGVGDVMDTLNSKSSIASRAMSGLGAATGLLEAPLSALVVGTGGLVAGLTAAGAGLGVFGAVAMGAYSEAKTALDLYSQAQATSGAQHDKLMAKYQAAMAALPPSVQTFVKAVEGAGNAWQDFVNKNVAGVTTVMTQGIGLLPKIFAAMQPFLAPVEAALTSIIQKLSTGLDSSKFKAFIDLLANNAGPAIQKVFDIVGHLLELFGGIVTAFMPFAQTILSGLDQITAAFAKWGETLTSHSGFQSLISTVKSDGPILLDIFKHIADAALHIVDAMTGLATPSNSKWLLQLIDGAAKLLDQLTKTNPELIRMGLYFLAANTAIGTTTKLFSGVAGLLQPTIGLISGSVGLLGKWAGAAEDAGMGANIAAIATKAWAAAQWLLDAAFSPLGLAIVIIVGLGVAIYEAYEHFKTFHDLVNTIGSDLKGAWDIAANATQAAVNWIIQAVEGIPAALGQAWNAIVSAAQTAWNTIVSAAQTAWNTVTSAISSAWNTIYSTVSSAVNTVVNAVSSGWNTIASGVSSAWDTVTSAISSAWNTIYSTVSSAVNTVVNAVSSGWNTIASGVSTAWNTVVSAVQTAWNSVVSAVSNGVNAAVNAVANLGSQILNAVSNFGNLLYNAGVAIINGLINGIASAIGTLQSYLGNIASWIASWKGPLDKDLVLLHPHGQAIMKGLMAGIGSQLPALKSQLGDISTTISGTVGAGTRAAGAGTGPAGAGTLQIEWVGTNGGDEFMTWLRKNIRIKGGNVQTVLGR